MNYTLTAFISLFAVAFIFSIAATFLGGVIGFWTEPSRGLRCGFSTLLTLGITVAIWATFRFQFEPRQGLRLVGVPFPVHVFLLQDRAWNEIDWARHRRFGIGVNIIVIAGLVSAPISIAMIVRHYRRRRSKRRLRDGHCPICNYDLQYSSEQCPECGRTC